MILTLTPNPCVDKTVFIDTLVAGTFMRSDKCTCIPGGKGTNVSRAVKALGRPTKAMVIVGGHPGAHVVEMIEQQDGVECVPVWVESQTRTITTVLEESIHRQTAFFEPGSQVSASEALDLREMFAEHVLDAGVVTLNGTVPDPSINTLYRELIPIARDAGAKVILDSHGPPLKEGVEAAPDMVKPNLAETEGLLGRTISGELDAWRAIMFFHAKGIPLVVMSLGAQGALVSDTRGERHERLRVRPPVIQEINPVGSGDCLVAGFAIGLLEGMPLEDMARLGAAAGTANAMTWDIAHFELEQVNAIAKQVQIERL